MIEPYTFIESLRSYKGVKYRHQGRSRYGLDCLGLILKALQDSGANVKDESPADYSSQVDPNIFLSGVYRRSTRIWIVGNGQLMPKAWHPGTLLIFRFSRKPQHLGVATYGDEMIHAYQGGPKQVAEHALHGWGHRIYEARWLEFLSPADPKRSTSNGY